jgi:predicted type IV restriction endonuclease
MRRQEMPQRNPKIQETFEWLQTLSSIKADVNVALEQDAQSGLVESYHGEIMGLESGFNPELTLFVKRAFKARITQNSERDTAYVSLREAREAAMPSANASEALAADLELSFALSREPEYDDAFEFEELEVGSESIKKIFISKIDYVM